MKASAGSGKTFSLAKNYISLLFNKKDSYSYRHILAVTFTNKATEEMKTRILKELSILSANPEESHYYKDFVPALFTNESDLRKAASEVLCNILHDYGAFSVSTIDRFFQQTLRAFSREIGQFSSYQVELDKSSLVKETVDRVLDSLTENDSAMLKWLTDSAMDQIEQGNRYNLDSTLYDMADRLKSEEYRVTVEANNVNEAALYNRDNLNNTIKRCKKIICDFEDAVSEAAKAVEAGMGGLSDDDFFRGFIGKVHQYVKKDDGPQWGKKGMGRPSASFLSKACDPDKWFAKKNAHFLPQVQGSLEQPLCAFCDLFESDDYRAYKTAFIIKDQIYSLGITGELFREFNALMKEKNVLSIDDSNLILKDIIAGSDAPFVYEKTGVKYENFLLDEFQDTSRIQWDNFYPLLSESVANNNHNLIVGDVKQSIYRWRNSDWKMLEYEIEKQFEGKVKVETLDTNYRSYNNVVEFNNDFFPFLAKALDSQLGFTVEAPDGKGFIGKLYDHVKQNCNKSGKPGCVSVSFCPEPVANDSSNDSEPQNIKELELLKVLEAVREAQAAGAKLSDIAVLVRRNSDGASVAEYLIGEGFTVVTNDSLKVKSSLTVNRLVSLLSYVDNPANTVGTYFANNLGIEVPREYQSLVDLCEELIRGLREHDNKSFESETAYVQSFVDAVSDYALTNGNNLHDFLQWWDGADPAISSPDGGDAIRIITVHKAKGLDFQYVIFPFAESVPLFRADRHWCVPKSETGRYQDALGGVYDVNLSKDCGETLFAGDYDEEKRQQVVDNINVFYVALTRAVQGMHIIAAAPTKGVAGYDGDPDSGLPEFSKFSDALYLYVKSKIGKSSDETSDEKQVRFSQVTQDYGTETFRLGELTKFDHKDDEKNQDKKEIKPMKLSYLSWPINIKEKKPGEEGRLLLLSGEYSDFFSEDAKAGAEASPRLRGIVLHDILSQVSRPKDLDTAVDGAVMAGELTEEEAARAREMLRSRISSAVERGWFSDEAVVRNEVELIDSDGEIYRPDRVEIHPDGKVNIIDYKFGAHRRHYETQIAEYAGIWRKMGYQNVTAFLWYVFDDKVVEGGPKVPADL